MFVTSLAVIVHFQCRLKFYCRTNETNKHAKDKQTIVSPSSVRHIRSSIQFFPVLVFDVDSGTDVHRSPKLGHCVTPMRYINYGQLTRVRAFRLDDGEVFRPVVKQEDVEFHNKNSATKTPLLCYSR